MSEGTLDAAGQNGPAANGAPTTEMATPSRLSKDSWLHGATDLVDEEVYVEAINDSVKIRSLSAGQLARITDQCLSMKGDQAKVDSRRMSVLKFVNGVVEPKFDEQEANVIAHQFGKSYSLVVSLIDEISEATEEDIAKAKSRFRPRR